MFNALVDTNHQRGNYRGENGRIIARTDQDPLWLAEADVMASSNSVLTDVMSREWSIGHLWS